MLLEHQLRSQAFNLLLAENGENLLSAQPRISAHSEGPKI